MGWIEGKSLLKVSLAHLDLEKVVQKAMYVVGGVGTLDHRPDAADHGGEGIRKKAAINIRPDSRTGTLEFIRVGPKDHIHTTIKSSRFEAFNGGRNDPLSSVHLG